MATRQRPPASLLNALRLLMLCLLIELLGFAFSGGYSVGNIGGVVVGSLCVYGLMRLMYRGIAWARLVLAGVIGLGLISSLLTVSSAYRQHPGATVVDLIATIIGLIALALLFSNESNRWFETQSNTNAT